jgi:site-specific recombinase XerD
LSRALITQYDHPLIRHATGKDEISRVSIFARWQAATGRTWTTPDLAAYRDHQLDQGKKSSTIGAHLATLRSAYARLLAAEATRDQLYTLAGEELHRLGHADTPANRKAFVDERLTRLANALAPDAAPISVTKVQDMADAQHIRLTKAQAEALLDAPGVVPTERLRDTALLAFALCTGLREMELCNLEVSDLRQHLGGELAVLVREGKGCKQRLVPYGELVWCLVIVDKWLKAAGLKDGKVFRSLRRGGQRVRDSLSVRAVENIVTKYPVPGDDGRLLIVRPHDLRRTYARQLYNNGVDLVSISQNLGHTDTRTTLAYIGTLDATQRRAPRLYSYDLSKLKAVK